MFSFIRNCQIVFPNGCIIFPQAMNDSPYYSKSFPAFDVSSLHLAMAIDVWWDLPSFAFLMMLKIFSYAYLPSLFLFGDMLVSFPLL
jgi:hypothetical protein